MEEWRGDLVRHDLSSVPLFSPSPRSCSRLWMQAQTAMIYPATYHQVSCTPRPSRASQRQVRLRSIPTARAAPSPQGGALRAKLCRFPLPGAEVQQQRREWLQSDLRSMSQRLEHGAQRRRVEGYLRTLQEVPE